MDEPQTDAEGKRIADEVDMSNGQAAVMFANADDTKASLTPVATDHHSFGRSLHD